MCSNAFFLLKLWALDITPDCLASVLGSVLSVAAKKSPSRVDSDYCATEIFTRYVFIFKKTNKQTNISGEIEDF